MAKEIIALKRDLVKLMEPNENANMAMQRLKAALPKSNGVGSTAFVPKKKNVRIKQDVVTPTETPKVVEESKSS